MSQILNHILNTLSIGMTLSKHSETCNHAISMLQNDEIEASVIYINILRDFFIELEAIPVLILKDDEGLKSMQDMLKSDLSKLRKVRTMQELGQKTKSKMISNVSNLQEYLCRFSKHLQYEDHEQ